MLTDPLLPLRRAFWEELASYGGDDPLEVWLRCGAGCCRLVLVCLLLLLRLTSCCCEGGAGHMPVGLHLQPLSSPPTVCRT